MTRILIPLLTMCFVSSAQQPGTSAGAPAIRTTTREVLLDVVVRDKHGKLVRDLNKDDLEVFDDGVRQQVSTFTFRDGMMTQAERDREVELTRNGAVLNPLREINLVSIVYERIGPDGRRVANQFVEDFLKNEIGPNTFVGIFTLNRSLGILVPYTNKPDVLRAGAKRAAISTVSDLNKMAAEVAHNIYAARDTGTQGPQSASAGNAELYQPLRPGSAEVRGPSSDSVLAGYEKGLIQFESQILHRIQGMDTMAALRALINQQNQLPGRKTILYLSEGLIVPPGQVEYFRHVIGEANRAHVSFYTIDVNGLNPMLATARDASLSGGRITVADGGVYLQENLAELAESTGGFLMANSNDLKSPLKRVMEESRSHYELTYSPQIEIEDGRYRTIAVKLRKSGMTVQSRKGYFALPELGGELLQPYEVACLQALNTQPLPRNVEYRAAALRFRAGQDGRVQELVAFESPAQDLTLTPGLAGKAMRGRLSFFALVKDSQGQIVEKVSRDLPVEVPPDKVEALKRGAINFFQSIWLLPGRYTLVSAVVDHEGNRSAARRASLVVAEPRKSLSMSSLALVRRLDPLDGPRDADDPMQIAEGRITPLLSDAITASANGSVSFYFVVYPHAGSAEKPKLTVQFLHDGEPMGETNPGLPAPETDGAMPMIASVPVSKFAPGLYQALVTVQQGASTVQESRAFQIR